MDSLQQQLAAKLSAAQGLRQAVGPYARAILVTTPQGAYAVPVEDQYVGVSLRFTGKYSEEELQVLRAFCNPQTRLLVVGAHIGALAIPLARSCRHVVAIEANPNTFELLSLNVVLNGLTNCQVLHKAASDKIGKLDFLLSTANSGGSKRMPAIKDPIYWFDNPQTVSVDAAPLDELLPDQTFDVILMDIEGSEYFALRGMPRILAAAQVLQVEFLPPHLTTVAGVSATQFAETLTPHFISMAIPHRRAVVPREKFAETLEEMCARNESDAGLIFSKFPPEQMKFT